MTRIGSFKKVSGELKGQINTLTIQAKTVRFIPEEPSGSSAPSHRIVIGDAEVGAAWPKTTRDDRRYLSVKLDDPSFTAPVFAQLFENEAGEFDLVWTRPVRRDRE